MGNRDTEHVIMSVQKATLLMDPFFKLTCVGTALLITFLARMVKEHKIKKGEFKNIQEFMKAADGQYNIVNVPVPDTGDGVRWLGAEGFGKELDSLRAMGVRFMLMPDLNKGDGFEQLMIHSDDRELFEGWFERYLTGKMQGGEHLKQDLKNLTEGKVSIQSIPAEGMEKQIAEDFKNLGINYSVLPDLNVGDGEIQIVVANCDAPKVEYWFRLYKEDQYAKGNEVKEMKTVSMEEYTRTANMTEEAYVDTASAEMKQANEKYEGRKPGDIEQSVSDQEMRIRNESDIAYDRYNSDPEYQKIFIDRKSCVEGSHFPDSEKQKAMEKGLFPSRVPGTWHEGGAAPELTLILPCDQVFETNDGNTFIAFMKKNEKPYVAGGDGKVINISNRMTGSELFQKHYDQVKWESHKKQQLNPGQKIEKPLDFGDGGKYKGGKSAKDLNNFEHRNYNYDKLEQALMKADRTPAVPTKMK